MKRDREFFERHGAVSEKYNDIRRTKARKEPLDLERLKEYFGVSEETLLAPRRRILARSGIDVSDAIVNKALSGLSDLYHVEGNPLVGTEGTRSDFILRILEQIVLAHKHRGLRLCGYSDGVRLIKETTHNRILIISVRVASDDDWLFAQARLLLEMETAYNKKPGAMVYGYATDGLKWSPFGYAGKNEWYYYADYENDLKFQDGHSEHAVFEKSSVKELLLALTEMVESLLILQENAEGEPDQH